MRWVQSVRLRTRALLRGHAVDRDLADEMRDHLDHLVSEYIARGMTPDAARAAAHREFGPMFPPMEASRDARGVAWIANLAADTRYGARLLRRTPGFASAAILTIALGIGATTAMFSIVYGVLLKPLPYGEPERLVNLWTTAPTRGLPRAFVGMANVYDWKARNHVFEDIAALRSVANFNLIGQGAEPERLFGSRVSANLLSVLEVAPLLGRGFTDDEDEVGHERVAILSYGLWKRRFASDPTIVGRDISLSGVAYTVVGVMGPDFAFPSRDYQIWVPLTFDPSELITRQNYSYLAVARLKPGVTLAQASADLTAIAAQIEREHPKENTGIGATVAPMQRDAIETVRTPLYMLLAAVLAMLLIGCANLANLLLARALVRRRELAIRAALGAGRARLVSQSIAELLPMLAIGGVIGLTLAAWTIAGVVPLLPADLPRAENIALQVPVLLFGLAMLTGIAGFVGAWPALEASRKGLATAAAELSRGNTGGGRRARARDMLVVAQIAATLWLAIGAVILTRSFAALKDVDPGFNPQHVYTVHLAIPRTKYRDDRAVADFCRRLVERVQALPGVVAAGMVNRLPLGGGAQTAGVEFEGIESPLVTPGIGLQADMRPVTPDYFRAMRIPVISGRTFTDADDERGPAVIIIDERLANTVFKGVDPVGRRLRPAIPGEPWRTIVGVVGHIRHERLDEDGRPQVYWSYKQNAQDRQALVVRTTIDPSTIAPAIAGAIRSIDPEQPMYDARTLDAVVDRSLAQRWLQTAVLAVFAGFAILLASIGVYGVTSYAVGQRLREFGIRLALGASRREIVGLVMRKGGILFAAGGAIGTLAAAASGRALATMLYRVRAFDPVSFGVAIAVLLIVALTACYLPARRAGAVDPTLALRSE
jgi:putative ABC transport system permease protein